MRAELSRTARRVLGALAVGLAGAALAQGVPEPGIELYGKVWSPTGLLVNGSLTWRYTPPAGASVEVTVSLQNIVTPAGEHFSYRASIPAESAVPGYPSTGNALPVTEATVQYTRAAFIDGVQATIAGGRTTDTFSADERGKVERVDLAVGGAPIPVGGIAGTVTYAGRQTGAVVVQVSLDPAFAGVPERQAEATPARGGVWHYACADLPAGAYYVRAFMDTEADGEPGDTEAQGVYALNPAQLPPEATDVNLLLVDADRDHDGLPDWWEALRPGGAASGFGDDDDGDGAWNGLEYALGTNPDDQDSVPGPVAWWRLDEVAGSTAADASGSLHNGTVANGPVWTDGIYAGALRFDGADGQVTVPSSPDLSLTGALTLQAWVRREGTWTHDGRILSKHDAALDTGYSLGINSADGKLELRLGDGFSVVSTGVIASGRWVHVAATLDAGVGAVTLYIDGRPDSTHAHTDACTTNALDLCIGNAASGGQAFAGLIDEPKIFNYARSVAAIAAEAFAVTAFAINNGATATNRRTVSLDVVCVGNPVDYMASERADFADASWQPYATAPAFTLAAGDGLKRVYIRVRSADDESGPVSDSIILDTVAPAASDVDAATPDGIYAAGSVIELTVTFSEPVTVMGIPQLRLETGGDDGVADYVSGSGTSTLSFRYTVGAGQTSARLDQAGTGALTLNGGALRDDAGNDAELTLPAPGAPHSLGANRVIAVGNVRAVTYRAGANGHVDGTTTQIVVAGGSTTAVTATADFGYAFDRWEDNLPGNRDNPRTLTNVQTDLTLTASFRAAGVENPDGPFTAVVDASAPASGSLWELTGNYSTAVKGDSLALDLLHDPTGRLAGTATYTVASGTAVTMPIRGSVKGSRGSITLKGTLKGTNAAKSVDVSLTLDLTLDTARRQLVGRLTGNVRNGAATTPVATAVTLDLPARMDGTWTLAFQLDQTGRAGTGTAELALSNQVTHTFVVRGKTGANGAAVLTLSGAPTDPAAKAITIKATITPLEGGWARIESFAGRGYGQAVGW